jgi:Zn-dependent M28 family amino/carboxypeptidase
MMRRPALRLALLLPALMLTACSRSVTELAAAQPLEVDSAGLMRVAGALAHDSMEGRAAGAEGGARARRLVIRELTARGVAPLGGAYEHPFEYPRGGSKVQAVNVLGMIRGTEWPDRYIVASAHYDHVGVRDGVIYNGADDNASGTAALLELASWFAANPPHHSIVIAILDAEEAGLRGARAFIAEAPVPLAAIVADINMDMIGRNAANELYAVGTRLYPQLKQYVQAAARGAAITVRFGHDGGVAGGQDWTDMSDQAAFHQAGIPFLYFGVEDHPDYHRPTDDIERLMPRFYAAAAGVVVDTARRLDLDR